MDIQSSMNTETDWGTKPKDDDDNVFLTTDAGWYAHLIYLSEIISSRKIMRNVVGYPVWGIRVYNVVMISFIFNNLKGRLTRISVICALNVNSPEKHIVYYVNGFINYLYVI